MKKLDNLFDRVIQYARVDAAVDQVSAVCMGIQSSFPRHFDNSKALMQMAVGHIHSCLPPLVTKG